MKPRQVTQTDVQVLCWAVVVTCLGGIFVFACALMSKLAGA